MARHPRHLIRHAVKAALLNRTIAEERVQASRFIPWRPKDLPAIAIYTLTEGVDPASEDTAPRRLARRVDVGIEAAVTAGEDVDDVLDALAQEIEDAIDADLGLGGTVSKDVLLTGTETTVLEGGDQTVGIVRLTYAAEYYTEYRARDSGLDDLKTVDTRHDLEGAQEAVNQAHDVVTGLDQV